VKTPEFLAQLVLHWFGRFRISQTLLQSQFCGSGEISICPGDRGFLIGKGPNVRRSLLRLAICRLIAGSDQTGKRAVGFGPLCKLRAAAARGPGLVLLFAGFCAPAGNSDYFAIKAVDEQTGRGIPLVELRTINEIRYYTDSAGVIAFHEPGLMDREVFFFVSSHGYEVPKDGFGFRGVRLRTKAGETARVKLRRLNLAERLYRVTGQGVYRDTVLLGGPVPIKEPGLNGRVLGQDSVQAAVYHGKIYWFWGDTQRESYPLGQFATAGAASELPAQGGLDPKVGVNLNYFVDAEGFSRKMAPLSGEGLIWIDALVTVNDDSGRERLIAHYSRMKSLGERLEHGLILFNDQTETFEHLVQFDLNALSAPGGHALKVKSGDSEYIYFAQPYPFVRVRADWKHIHDAGAYEAFTCLAPGAGYDRDSPKLDRADDGRLRWSWKAATALIDTVRQRELIERGHIKTNEAWINLRDVAADKLVHAQAASVRWNDYRDRYVMIVQELYGSPSFGGEIWYAEADAPEGPWLWARKIVSHRDYTFYNPCHHIFFDQEGGRFIYFEGTYTAEFSGAKDLTPRYNYNQIMYRLDLSDPRLRLPDRREPQSPAAAK
jgi:hypothetical protein